MRTQVVERLRVAGASEKNEAVVVVVVGGSREVASRRRSRLREVAVAVSLPGHVDLASGRGVVAAGTWRGGPTAVAQRTSRRGQLLADARGCAGAGL